MQSSVNALNATELYIFKWLKWYIFYVSVCFTSTLKSEKISRSL